MPVSRHNRAMKDTGELRLTHAQTLQKNFRDVYRELNDWHIEHHREKDAKMVLDDDKVAELLYLLRLGSAAIAYRDDYPSLIDDIEG